MKRIFVVVLDVDETSPVGSSFIQRMLIDCTDDKEYGVNGIDVTEVPL